MLTPVRKYFLFTLLAALTSALIWGTGILYWHFHLRSVFRTFEETSAPGGSPSDDVRNQEALETLSEAGCRTLPYFVQALDKSKPIQFLQTATRFIARHSVDPEVTGDIPSSPLSEGRLSDWMITSADSDADRAVKCERIRAWWKKHGAEEHQVWRFWTNRCRTIDPRELVD